MSTFTASKGLEQVANSADVNSWDVPTNSNWGVTDVGFGGNVTINAAGASGTANLTSAQYQPPNITITGAPSGNISYQFPASVGWNGSVLNSTTGNATVTFISAGGGRTTLLPKGYRVQLTCDAVNVDLATTAPSGAAGNSTWVQFNTGGVLAASSQFIWDGGNVTAPAIKLNGSSSGFVGFQAPATVTTSLIWTLPNGDGTNGQVLITNGAGVLSWGSGGGGGGSGVSSFNGRSGAVSLQASDVTTALSYTPVNPLNVGNLTNPGLIVSGTPAVNAIGYLGVPPNGPVRNSSYTSVLADAGTEACFSQNATWTINGLLNYPQGTILVASAINSAVLTVVVNGSTLTQIPTGTQGARTVTAPGFIIANKKADNNWYAWGLGIT